MLLMEAAAGAPVRCLPSFPRPVTFHWQSVLGFPGFQPLPLTPRHLLKTGFYGV